MRAGAVIRSNTVSELLDKGESIAAEKVYTGLTCHRPWPTWKVSCCLNASMIIGYHNDSMIMCVYCGRMGVLCCANGMAFRAH